jgi:hypothetical protein
MVDTVTVCVLTSIDCHELHKTVRMLLLNVCVGCCVLCQLFIHVSLLRGVACNELGQVIVVCGNKHVAARVLAQCNNTVRF